MPRDSLPLLASHTPALEGLQPRELSPVRLLPHPPLPLPLSLAPVWSVCQCPSLGTGAGVTWQPPPSVPLLSSSPSAGWSHRGPQDCPAFAEPPQGLRGYVSLPLLTPGLFLKCLPASSLPLAVANTWKDHQEASLVIGVPWGGGSPRVLHSHL